jgi:geranylgeranyl reductase family protein
VSAIDVLVVGAGPAGATAARALAVGGARVTLVDRATFPRNKACGGAISVRALGRFPYLRTALERIPTHWLSRLHLESPNGTSALLTSPSPAALMIRRVEFDDLLVRLAVEAGVNMVEGVEIAQASETADGVELRARDGRVFRATLVIAADGVYSVIARRLGVNPGWAAATVALDMMEETPNDTLTSVDPQTLWLCYGYGGSEGYAYVFPKRHHVNVGIGYVLDYFRTQVNAVPYDVQSSLIDVLRSRGVLSGRSSRAHFTPYQIPVGGPIKRTSTNRVLLAGDAGGFVNGITAEGIYYAMVSGDLAARALLGAGPSAYRRLWKREIGGELRDAVLVQRDLLTTPERINRLVAGTRGAPDLAAHVIQYAMGEVSYQSARRRLLAAAPLAAVRLFIRHFRGTTAARPALVAAQLPGSRIEI